MPSTLTIITITVVVLYFALLFVIARLTTRKSIDNQTFFLANRESPWYVVAFGMVGTTFSGVTFISVPGWVGATEYSYFQMVIGYIAGYSVIALILMPLYYRLNLTSIYRFLQQRIGVSSYKTGSAFFLLSRSIGAAFRLYLIAIVFQVFVFREFNIPFYIAVLFTLLLIWIYTHRGGIKTIVYTDTLQTALMLFALIVSIVFLTKDMGLNFSNTIATINQSNYSQLFFWDWRSPEFFPKQ
ncbi:MAG: sodium:solute symporter, partial [Bacteroidetes bacterium SW_10_40_5]